MEQNDKGAWEIDENQFLKVKCDFIISAFGSCVSDERVKNALEPLKLNKWGYADVDTMTLQSKTAPYIFCGGDLVGNGLTVEASNDGKHASWFLHRYIQSTFGINVSKEPQLPLFYTPVDDVDISVELCGVRFPNPFGLAR